MWRTRVGYAGGTSPDPTYTRLGDHTECYQVDFDPSAISYDDLLEYFWTTHDATRPAYKQQYASLVLAADDRQLEAAKADAERLAGFVGRPVLTRIGRLDRFYLAEDYHQKYYLRNDRALMPEFRAMFGEDEDAFRDSTAAARVNGYLGGEGTAHLLEREVDRYGLSEAAQRRLMSSARIMPGGIGCSIG